MLFLADLLVGAYSSDSAVMLRTRPIVDITAKIDTSPNPIPLNPDSLTCSQDGMLCFTIFVDFRLRGQRQNATDIKSTGKKTLAAGKLSALSFLKAFADDKLNVTENIEVALHWVENIVRKGENASYKHFLFFPYCFKRAFDSESSKTIIDNSLPHRPDF